ncbi:ABC transporter ATP-binding protein [Allopusillimonas ginsengisoli]|uniref:ABC transporter ATP-binding protein n=1 Tax=Allopusillimonas ginsengisoli TaxID=453575 RepID=UPI0010218C93|nr:ABC transporter ATP-binding protein [Allopusillimonas ginsengisoli]TEA74176.1 ABC transporter ATP-binding protein [Allopusillimonas ginsengisoli]
MTAPDMEMVRLASLEKSYKEVKALAPTNLSIAKGEFLTLLGPSGSGKTTILNLIAGSLAPSGGHIYINGRDVTNLPAKDRSLGMVFQSYALMPHMTIFDNIAFPLRVRKLPHKEINERVTRAMELVRLPNVGKRKPRELSGGQQQRVSIARCLVYRPDLILMDEPLGALDKKLRDQLQREIKHIHRDTGVTLMYVTHDQSEALALSDRICLLNNGNIEQLGRPHELYFQPRTIFAADFLGESNLLDAQVVGNGRDAEVLIEGIGSVHGLDLFRQTLPTGRLKVMLRPECLALGPATNCRPYALTATVTERTLVGELTELNLCTESGVSLCARTLTEARVLEFQIGDSVQLCFRASDMVALES